MIKVKYNGDVEKVKTEYPCLKISKEDGRIVLFTGPNVGYEIFGGNNPYKFLEYATNWAELYFKLCTGTLELSNDL